MGDYEFMLCKQALPFKEKFLKGCPPFGRSGAVGLILEAIKNGCTDGDHVVQYIRVKIKQSRGLTQGEEYLNSISDKLIKVGFQYYYPYSKLSNADRQRIKALKVRPPTARQLWYLSILKYQGNMPSTLDEASELIDSLVQKKENQYN